MKYLLTALLLLSAVSAKAAATVNPPYQGITLSTTTGRASQFLSGYFRIAGSSSTADTTTIFLNGQIGSIEASSMTLTYGIKASTGVFSGNVTAGSFTGALTGNVTGNVTGALTGNATTATALAANPTNCAAGNYPLGIDASGNVESCTAIGTADTATNLAGGSRGYIPFQGGAGNTVFSSTFSLGIHGELRLGTNNTASNAGSKRYLIMLGTSSVQTNPLMSDASVMEFAMNGAVSHRTGFSWNSQQSIEHDTIQAAYITMYGGSGAADGSSHRLEISIGTNTPTNCFMRNANGHSQFGIDACYLAGSWAGQAMTATSLFQVGPNGASSFTVTESGAISGPSQSGAHVQLGNGYTAVSGVQRDIYWDSGVTGVNFNNNNTWNATASSHTFKARGAGFYFINACVQFPLYTAAAASPILLRCDSGSVSGPTKTMVGPVDVGTHALTICATGVIQMTDGATIICSIKQTTGGALTYGTDASQSEMSFLKIW